MKIAIIGNAGSGKSTLAYKLHAITGIPLYHLDQYFWKPGWQEPDRDEFEIIHNELCDKPTWIIEGVALRLFHYRIRQADIVIFLDIPTYRCLYRVIKRALINYGKVRPTSAPGCHERGPDRKFLKFMLSFNATRKQYAVSLMDFYSNEKKIFVAKNQREVQALIALFERDYRK